METKKAYGVVTALGAKLGERAKSDETLLARVRAAPDLPTFAALVRAEVAGLVPDALISAFFGEVVTEGDWVQWRARLLLQMKLTREGGKPAPGHEAGRGVRR